MKNIYALLLVVDLWWFASASERKFFKIDATASNLPLPQEDLPDQLQGLFWMDQSGYYGHSDFLVSLMSAPDLAFSFNGKFDKKARTVTIDVTGPSWQWMNNGLGILFSMVLEKLKFEYVVEFNENYTYGQIYPTVSVFGSRISVPAWLVNFGFELADPHSPCPPPEGTSKRDITKCATWHRPSTGLALKPLGSWGVVYYHMYRIADKSGIPIQPYYDVFLKYGKASASPPTTLASMLGINLGFGKEADTSFVVVKDAPSSFAEGTSPRGSEL